MFESIVPAEMDPVRPVPGDPGAVLVRAAILALADMDQDVSEGVRIDRITALEELKAAAAAAQARETEAFVASRRETRAAAGVAAEKRGRAWPRRSAWHARTHRTGAGSTWAWPPR